MLSLDAEQEARRKRVHFPNARFPRRVVVPDRHVQVAVVQRYKPPHDGETQPAEHKVHREHQQRPSPLSVDKRRKYVLKADGKTDGLRERAGTPAGPRGQVENKRGGPTTAARVYRKYGNVFRARTNESRIIL